MLRYERLPSIAWGGSVNRPYHFRCPRITLIDANHDRVSHEVFLEGRASSHCFSMLDSIQSDTGRVALKASRNRAEILSIRANSRYSRATSLLSPNSCPFVVTQFCGCKSSDVAEGMTKSECSKYALFLCHLAFGLLSSFVPSSFSLFASISVIRGRICRLSYPCHQCHPWL